MRALDSADQRGFIELMDEAFAEDPLFVAALRTEGAREAFLGWIFESSQRVGAMTLGEFEGAQLIGCIIVEPPRRSRTASWGSTVSALRFLGLVRRLGARNLGLLNTYARESRNAAPREQHHYVTMIGVRARSRGRGVGSTLINAAIEFSRQHPRSQGLALDTENEANVELYRRWGFQLTATIVLSDFSVFSMYRDHEEHQ